MQNIEICRLYELDTVSSNIMKVCVNLDMFLLMQFFYEVLYFIHENSGFHDLVWYLVHIVFTNPVKSQN